MEILIQLFCYAIIGFIWMFPLVGILLFFYSIVWFLSNITRLGINTFKIITESPKNE